MPADAPIKVILLFQRAPELSATQFQEEWTPWTPADEDDAGSFADTAPGLTRYHRNTPVNAEMPITDARTGALDVIEELWFESPESARAFLSAAATQERLWPQRRSHLRPGPIGMLAGEPDVAWEKPARPAEDAVKLLMVSARREAMTREESARYWRHHHWPLVLAGPRELRGQRVEYLPASVEPFPTFAEAPFDACLSVHFDSFSVMMKERSGPYYDEVLRPDEPRFADSSRASGIMANEQVVFVRQS